jgi:membrane-bound lytic murein transglycosylase B
MNLQDRSAGWMRRLILVVIVMGSWATSGVALAQDMGLQAYYKGLQQRLIKDGFDAKLIEKIYTNSQLSFEAKGISQYFVHNEATLNYDQFLSRRSIRKARHYMVEHQADLENARKRFAVDPQIITAVILVETKLGTYLGSRSILNTLSTMAVLDEATPREAIWQEIPEEKRLTRQQFEEKADSKANWAYGELKAFLTYTIQQGIEPYSITGSYAGAVGIAQFMPSNILLYGQDGDQDGRIDLFNHADAINSIASYLKYYGWRPGMTKDQAGKVIYNYNHSPYYVDTVLKIAQLLKG